MEDCGITLAEGHGAGLSIEEFGIKHPRQNNPARNSTGMSSAVTTRTEKDIPLETRCLGYVYGPEDSNLTQL